MGRERRPTQPGVYHLMARSIAGERIFELADDLDDLVRLIDDTGHTWFAFCGMPTHYHLLGHVPEGRMPKLMDAINRRYAVFYNRRRVRRGRVFNAPYKAVPVTSNDHLVWLVRYLAQNPSQPRTWPWSSFVRKFRFVDDRFLARLFGGRERMLRYAFDAGGPPPLSRRAGSGSGS